MSGSGRVSSGGEELRWGVRGGRDNACDVSTSFTYVVADAETVVNCDIIKELAKDRYYVEMKIDGVQKVITRLIKL